jgi:putative tricarboxylic transport membrane protein
MRRVYLAAGVALLLLTLVVGWQAWSLRYYTPLGPGPGFFPLWLSAILGLLAAAIIAQAALSPAAPPPEDFVPPRSNQRRIVGAALALFAVAIAMSTLGFRTTMLAFYVVMLTMLGRRNPIEILVLSFLGSFGVYEVFDSVLKTPLPAGMFGF